MRTFSFWDSYEVYLLRTNYEAVSVRFLNGKNTRGNDTENGRDSGTNEKKFQTEEFESVFEIRQTVFMSSWC